MKSLYKFIISPLNERYDNTIKVEGIDLITNTTIEDHKSVSKKAVVIETPSAFKSKIKKGDHVIVHHNIFRRYYDMKGREKNSGSYFNEDKYFCTNDQIYLIKKENTYETNLNYCFVKPLLNTNKLSLNKELPLRGVIKYSNKYLSEKNIIENTLISFNPNSEFEFILDGEKLYCMKSNNIVLTHEHEGNEKENNPSWAKSR